MKKVALIGTASGAFGISSAMFGGGGSGAVVPKAPVSIYDALVKRLGSSVTLVTDQGKTSEGEAALACFACDV